MRVTAYVVGALLSFLNIYGMVLVSLEIKNTGLIGSVRRGSLLTYDWVIIFTTLVTLVIQLVLVLLLVSDINRSRGKFADVIGG